jgi:hypothetical protein
MTLIPVKTKNLRLARFAIRGAPHALSAFNLVLSVFSEGRDAGRCAKGQGFHNRGGASDNKLVFALVNAVPVHSYKRYERLL